MLRKYTSLALYSQRRLLNTKKIIHGIEQHKI